MQSKLERDVISDTVQVNDGTEVCWTSQGSGDAVLLAMGHAFTKEFWFRVAPVLAEHYRVLTFDNRGVGATRWDGSDFTMRDLADDAVAVLDAAGVDRAHVYGVSMGGGTVVEMALVYPERVRSLILGCTTAKTATPIPDRSQLASIPVETLKAGAGAGLYGTRPVSDELKREDQDVLNAMHVTHEGLWAQQRAVALYDSADRVGQIKAPTLVIHGTEDRAVPYELGRLLAAAIPGAKLVTLEGSGHGYLTDAAEEANRAVLEFLAEVP